MAHCAFISGWPNLSAYEFFIGMRYTRSKQRTRFISVITLISIVGIVLGMTVLITVLSVMNGFQQEIRTRILGVASHVQISGADNQLANWEPLARHAAANPQVEATAPYVSAQGLLTFGSAVRGAFIRTVKAPMLVAASIDMMKKSPLWCALRNQCV